LLGVAEIELERNEELGARTGQDQILEKKN
jgi:hypothetical protein